MLSTSVARFANRALAATRFYSSKPKISFDVTDATFQKEVVEASHHTPVVLDVWAEYVYDTESGTIRLP